VTASGIYPYPKDTSSAFNPYHRPRRWFWYW